MRLLHLDDVAVIAAAVLNITVQDVRATTDLTQLEAALLAQATPSPADEEFGLVASRASALAANLARRKPFPRGSSAIAWACVREFVWRNGEDLRTVSVDQATDGIRSLKHGGRADRAFAAWLQAQMSDLSRGAA